ncbi:MAG: hypothetical protein CK533_04950 [Acidobacterium sp.]|nr:hypothetical protein [Acidobacteriota bacterium]PHY11309.1 MAG: hypothetical protein CK533_04950 [Acidobacterium sp.]
MPRFDPLSRALGAGAALLGAVAAAVYWSAGLSLSHYDAKAHLVVARRILDSLTPSWEQIGAIWLPLPHVLNALPVQIDWMYQTGASAILISIVSFAVTVASLSALVMRVTGSPWGAGLAAAIFAANPNVLYLQSTPMTEPLLFALSSLVVLHLAEWALSVAVPVRRAVGWTVVAACLTRYEAWPIVGVAMALAAWVKWRRGTPLAQVVASTARLACYPAGAVLFFMGMSFASIGEWFVAGGFYVPDPQLQGQPIMVFEAILEGVADLGGPRLVLAAGVATAVLLVAALTSKTHPAALVMPLALLASAALPFYAFISGHPFRIRYEVPLILGCAACIGASVGLARRAAPGIAVILFVAIVVQARPFDRQAPMIVEAQLDRQNGIGRQTVTACLRQSYDGTTVMASMGALAHYMQELSLAGFHLADFLHEGSGPTWQAAYATGPVAFTGWVLIEEAAEGGDMLHQKATAWPAFLRGYERVCEGGNVALYRRIARTSS